MNQLLLGILFLSGLGFLSQAEAAHIIAGSENAKVQVVIWGDFQCGPTEFELESVPRLRAEYGDRIGVLYGQFPLAGHPEGLSSAIAAQCAENQGKFIPFFEGAFADQENLGRKRFQEIAEKIGVPDLSTFLSCLDSPVTLKLVKSERAVGVALGIWGTPFTYINGKLTKGGMPYSYLKAAIDKALRHQ